MASVSSLDQDMRKLRLDRYTPGAANEVRAWIEEVLGEKLPGGDLMESLKDGVALCRLVNLATDPGVRYKQSSMPFVQMENISNFLRACEMPPLGLPAHDRFLTVDLYEQKDPTQVLQCIAAFSRRANAVKPHTFQRTLGAQSKGGAMSPASTGSGHGYATSPARYPTPTNGESKNNFGAVNKTSYSPDRMSPTKPRSLGKGGFATGKPVSSWSNKDDESKSAPAWNIHQYGYMGGANAGNQGVAFGTSRQITSAAPAVPSLAEKERSRKEQAAMAGRQRQEAEELEVRRRADLEAEEAQAQAEEERKWELETQKQREKVRIAAEEEKRRWDEEQRLWRQEEEAARVREEQELEARLAFERDRQPGNGDTRQFLNQTQMSEGRSNNAGMSSESKKIQDLERQLAEAKQREAQYERERQARSQEQRSPRPLPRREEQQTQPRVEQHIPLALPSGSPSPPPPALPARSPAPITSTSHEDDWQQSERDFLKKHHQAYDDDDAGYRPPKPTRPENPTPVTASHRPLPTPDSSYVPGSNRTDRFLASNPAPTPSKPSSHRLADYSTTTEVDLEDQRRAASQQKTKAGGWASKSLLEREMERERERQREWEEAQKEISTKARHPKEGSNPGQSWDVHQYGYMGGDNQNRGGPGLGMGSARRQVIGPRPPP